MAWPPTSHGDIEDQIGLLQRPYTRSGYYNLGAWSSAVTTTGAVSAGFAFVRPFLVAAPTSFDRIGVNVTTAATAGSGGTIAFAIYTPGLGLPDTLLVETATVSSETTGAKEVTISVNLDPGVWWVGIRAATASCTVTSLPLTLATPYSSGSTTPPSAVTNFTALAASATGSGFPASYSSTTGPVHAVALRVA